MTTEMFRILSDLFKGVRRDDGDAMPAREDMICGGGSTRPSRRIRRDRRGRFAAEMPRACRAGWEV